MEQIINNHDDDILVDTIREHDEDVVFKEKSERA